MSEANEVEYNHDEPVSDEERTVNECLTQMLMLSTLKAKGDLSEEDEAKYMAEWREKLAKYMD